MSGLPVTEELGNEIRVQPDNGGRYRVDVEVDPDDRAPPATSCRRLGGIGQGPAVGRGWAIRRRVCQGFRGEALRGLFSGRVGEVYHQAAADGRLFGFRLIADHPELGRSLGNCSTTPAGGAFLALENPLVRGVTLSAPPQPPRADPPLRSCHRCLSPWVAQLAGQVRVNGIESLAGLMRRGQVEVAKLPHATLGGLQDALRERPAHVLHFIGLGLRQSDDRTVLLFEDEGGGADPVDPETLATLLRPYQVRLVFLNACQSAEWTALEAA